MNIITAASAISYAHSKLILSGEHAVVYGYPAIAIPFPLNINILVNYRPGNIRINSKIYSGYIDNIPDSMRGIGESVKETFRMLKESAKDIEIIIDSNVPLGRGLGSSAAVVTAITRGIFKYFDYQYTNEDLYKIVKIGESYAHGKPSGIDMMAVASDMPIVFKKQEGASSFHVKKQQIFVVCDSGKIGNTKQAVQLVKDRYIADTSNISIVLEHIGAITNEVKESLMIGDSKQLGTLLYENHVELRKLGVSNEMLDHLVEVSMDSGAQGAKLTGGGLGGCVLAVANTLDEADRIAKKLVEEGAVASWYFSTDQNEIYKTYYKDK